MVLFPITGKEKLTIRKNPTRTIVNNMSFEGKEFRMLPSDSFPNIKYKKIDGKIVREPVMMQHDITTFLLLLYSGEYGCKRGMTTVGNANVKAYTPIAEKIDLSNFAMTIVFDIP